MQIYLAGHLSWYDPLKRKSLTLAVPQPVLLSQVLMQCQVPVAEIAVYVINGQAYLVMDDLMIQDQDRVELYPPVDGGSIGDPSVHAKTHLEKEPS